MLLDLGSGSGTNTILPCLALFAECRIVATDLSPDLLRILRHYVVAKRLEERVVCVCTDAMRNFFRPQTFDFVVDSMEYILRVDPDRPQVRIHERDSGRLWTSRLVRGLDSDVYLPLFERSLQLSDLYHRLEFHPRPKLVDPDDLSPETSG
jgi:SAM-dependent methyltransferase